MRLTWLAFFATLPVLAQGFYPRHNFSLGLGAGMPGADLRVPFSDSVGMGVNYGYRFHRHFQADIGLDTLFGAARIRDFLPTEFGDRRIRDYQILLPFGGRAILPLAGGRLVFSGGGAAPTCAIKSGSANQASTCASTVLFARRGMAWATMRCWGQESRLTATSDSGSA